MKKKIVLVLALFVLMAAPLAVKFAVSTRMSAHASGGGPGPGGTSNGCQDSVTVVSNAWSYDFCTSGVNPTFLPNSYTVMVGTSWQVTVIASGVIYHLCPGQALDLAAQFSPSPPPTVVGLTLTPFNPGDTCTSIVPSGNGGSTNNNTNTSGGGGSGG